MHGIVGITAGPTSHRRFRDSAARPLSSDLLCGPNYKDSITITNKLLNIISFLKKNAVDYVT